MDPRTRDHVTADADFVTAPGGWSDSTINGDLREGILIDDDGSFATTSDIRYDTGAGERGENDGQRGEVTDRARAVRSSSGMRGDRTRTRDGRIRTKRGDTLVGSVEEKYNLNFGVRSDMHLSTLLARRGVESLSELLRAAGVDGSSDMGTAQVAR